MNKRTSIGVCVLIPALGGLLLSSTSWGQQTPSSSPQQSYLSLKVDVDLVLVNVTVTDGRNRFVQGLSKEHFQLWEDKVEQEITTFEREDTPVSLGIVLDRSGSMGGKKPKILVPAQRERLNTFAQSMLEQARSSAYSCLQQGQMEDEYFLIEFSDSPQLSADFTNDIRNLKDRLVFIGAGGKTALWDAIYAGVAKLQDAKYPRKALLVLTDGEENHSRYTLSQLKGALRERDVRIYTMHQPDVEIDGLQQLVKASGGMTFNSSRPCEELSGELRHQYILGYRSTNQAKSEAWHAIKVSINSRSLPKGLPNLTVRARAGYFTTQQ